MIAELTAPAAEQNADFTPLTNGSWLEAKASYLASWYAYLGPMDRVAKMASTVDKIEEEAAEKALEAATEAHRPTQQMMRDFPVTNHADLLDKLRLLANDLFDGDDPGEIAVKDLLRIEEAAASGDAAFNAARAAYEAAKTALDAKEAERKPTRHDLAVMAMPDFLVANSLHHRGLRWHSVDALMRDVTVSDVQRGAILPTLQRELAKLADVARLTPEEKEFDEATEALWNLVQDAETALIETPATSPEAAAFKARVAFLSLDEDKMGFESLGLIAFQSHHYITHRYPLAIYLDLLAAAGAGVELARIIEAREFNPDNWIDCYEAAGGIVSAPTYWDDLILTIPDGDDTATGLMRDELKEAPWKAHAVFLEAEHRRKNGGDPLVNSSCDHGRQDGRGHMKPFFGPIRHAEEIRVCREDGEGDLFNDVRLIDNRVPGGRTAESWISDWRAAGGQAFHLKGELYMGGPCGRADKGGAHTSLTAELNEDDDLYNEVRAILHASTPETQK